MAWFSGMRTRLKETDADEFDVVVVGAGPTGLMLACELRLAGVNTLVLDKLAEPVGYSKAMGVQARTVEVLELRGLADRFLDGAGKIPAGHFGNLGVPVTFGGFDTRHPYVLHIPQVHTERLLAERAMELGVEVRREHLVSALTQDTDGVTVEFTAPDGTHRVRAAYLVGCDGGASAIRKLAAIDFPGQDPEIFVLLADVRFTEELPTAENQGSFRRFGAIRPDLPAWFAAFPLGGDVYRATVAWFGRPFPYRGAPVTEEEMRAALIEVAGGDFGMHDMTWLSRFTDVSRQAERYREGRVFLAGDAAHVHLPAGGQGLNLGVQDAMNLGWKLGAAIRGWAPDGLLDSYHTERHPAAEDVLRNTRTQGVLMNPDPRYDALRATFRDLLRLPEVNRHLAGLISALGLRYELPGEHPLIGLRMPDLAMVTPAGQQRLSEHFHEGRGVLLATTDSGAAPTGWEDRVDLVTAKVPDLPGVDPLTTTAFLIRPDGYVSWVGDPAAEAGSLRTALETWFGKPCRREETCP